MSTKREELEQHLDALAAGGASLDDIYAELARLGEITDEEFASLPRDGAGRITLTVSDAEPTARGYFNIRDKSGGDQAKAFALAEWALRRYAATRAEIAETNLAASWRQEQVEAWRSNIVSKAERSLEFLEGVLDQYMQDFAPDERSVALPGGRLKLTKQRYTIEWDEPAALAWALEQDDVDKLAPRKLSRRATNERLDNITADGAVTADGETVEFVRMVPPAMRDKFSVELT